MEYVSTNVRLPRELLRSLKLRAVEEDKSMGEVLREVLVRNLKVHPEKQLPKKKKTLVTKGKHPLWKIVGLGSSGIRDGGVNHDKYLYGLPKSEWKK